MNLGDFPTIENHLSQFSRLINNYSENQSIHAVKEISHEIECIAPSELFKNSEILRLIDSKAIVCKYDGSLNFRRFVKKTEGLTRRQHLENMRIFNSENTYAPSKTSEFINESNINEYDYFIGEIVIQKQRTKKLYEIQELLWKLGIITDYLGQNGGHFHNGVSSFEGLNKLANQNFVNAFYDFHDYFGFVNNIKSKIYFNIKAQIRIYKEIARQAREGSSNSHYPQQRYFGVNCTIHKISDSLKQFKTMENRLAPVFMSYDIQHKYTKGYITFINKFLEFYKNVSAEQLRNNIIYKRVNQDKMVKGSELITANCLSMDQYVNGYYGSSSEYSNYNSFSSMGQNETIHDMREGVLTQ